MKKRLSFLLSALLLALILTPALPANAADGNLSGADYYLKLMSPDMQAFQGNETLAWSGSTPLTGYADLLNVYLAKNEKEGYQVYFYEKGDGRDLRLEVGEYRDAAGNTLPFEVFKEHFFTVQNVDEKFFADALIPYGGESVHVNPKSCAVFYVELRAAADQPAGEYASTFTLYDGDEVVRTQTVTATVWNFALPEARISTTIMGLYNASSGYAGTRGFLEQSGIRFQNGEVIPEDRAEVERILEGWQDFLLDHGVTPYEIPRFLIDDDPKAAVLAMADPRRKAVSIPLFSANGGAAVSAAGIRKIQQFKALAYDVPYLADKAFFYTKDEPGWTKDADAAAYDALHAQLETLWPGFHSVVPFNTAKTYGYLGQKLAATTDIFCPNDSALVGYQNVYDDYVNGKWHRTWRYLPMAYTGCIAVTRWGKTPMGVHAKVLYWQQAALNSSGILNWNCAYLPYVDGKPYDVWEKEKIYPGLGSANVNGEGIFAYESKSLGFDPATPIASLRLKHISNGMEDYDFLQLAKEAFGVGADSPYTKAMNTVLRYYTSKGPKYVFSCEKSLWPDGGNYEFVGHDGAAFTNARILLGEALSELGGVEHAYGDWQTVAEPDDAHNGLDVRKCAVCGAEESRKTALCEEGKHIFAIRDSGDETGHTLACVACGTEQTAAHTPKAVEGAAPTCGMDGRTDSVVCADCGRVLEAARVLPAAGHVFGEWVEGYPATCIATGIKPHKQCTLCGKYFDANNNQYATDILWKNSNHVGEEIPADEKTATCVEKGFTGKTVCSACNAVIKKGAATPVDPDHHTGATRTEGAAAATCTAAGSTGTVYCADCGKKLADPAGIPAAGHKWNGGAVTKEASCTGDGVTTYTCTVCGGIRTEKIPATGHTDRDGDGYCDIDNAPMGGEGSGQNEGEAGRSDGKCPYCGQTHTGFFGSIVGFFHRIAYFFKTLFRR